MAWTLGIVKYSNLINKADDREANHLLYFLLLDRIISIKLQNIKEEPTHYDTKETL